MSSAKPNRSPPTTSSTSKGKSAGSSSGGGGGTSTKRLLQELSQVRSFEKGRLTSTETSPIERLGPINDDSLFHWEAVINGKGLGSGYDGGRWLLDIQLPEGNGSGSYPNAPPKVKFVTRICAANVGFETGDICLDLLKDAWTPAYTLKMTVEAIWQMLAAPEVDSPLNVDIAALIRQGDRVGSEAVIRWGCGEWKWEGR